MKIRKALFLLIIGILLVPQLVSAKTKTIYVYEDTHDRIPFDVSIRDFLLSRLYVDHDKVNDEDYYNTSYIPGETFTLPLIEGSLCDKMSDNGPIINYREKNSISDEEYGLGNLLKEVEGQQQLDIVSYSNDRVNETRQKLCKNLDKYVKQDYDEIKIVVKEGSAPTATLELNATSIDKALDTNIASIQFLGILVVSGEIESPEIEELIYDKNAVRNQDTLLDLLDKITFKKNGKTLATLSISDFTLDVSKNISFNDNMSFDSDRIIDAFYTFLEEQDIQAPNINSEMQELFDSFQKFKIILTDKKEVQQPSITNPKTFANFLIIFMLSVAILTAGAVVISKKQTN